MSAGDDRPVPAAANSNSDASGTAEFYCCECKAHVVRFGHAGQTLRCATCQFLRPPFDAPPLRRSGFDPDRDPISAPPDRTGRAGRAWRLEAQQDIQSNEVLTWIIEAPWAHPFWHSYCLELVHLRPMPGFQPIIYLPGATHELAIWALDPSKPRAPQIEQRGEPLQALHPANFAAQFVADGDDIAAKLIEVTVSEVLDGRLSPDTDFVSQWIIRFGDSLMRR